MNAPKCSDPNFLQNIESAILRACETHRVIEQRSLHDSNQVFKCFAFPGLAPKYKPLIVRPVCAVWLHLYLCRKKAVPGSISEPKSFPQMKGPSALANGPG